MNKIKFLILLVYIIFYSPIIAMADQYISLYQNLTLLSKFLVAPQPPKEPFAKEPFVGAKKLIEDLKKQVEDEKAKADAKKKENEKKKEVKIGEAKINIKNFMQIGPLLNSVQNMAKTKPKEKIAQKDKAREFINALHEFVISKKTTKLTEGQQKQISETAQAILAIDPLLISTAIATLKDSQLSQDKLYDLMVKLYEAQIVFLEKEIPKIKENVQLYKGVRDDIDEAMSYPFEIANEIQEAAIKSEKDQDKQAGKFVQDIEDLRQRLLALLRENKKKLQDTKEIPVDEYIEMIETKRTRAYCAVEQDPKKLEACGPYKSFFSDLNDIKEAIKNYNSKKYTKSKKIFEKQNIIKKLSGFITYSSDPKFCQICINADFRSKDGRDYDIDSIVNMIKDFFQKLPVDEQNAGTQNAIELAEQIRKIVVDRRKYLKEHPEL